MTTATRFYVFTTDLTNAKHDFSSHSYKVMLSNTAPVVTNSAKANITEITAGNGYTAGGTATTITKSNTLGVETVAASDVVFTAAGGSIGPFRYVVLYNDTQTTPAKPLVCWWDHGSSVTVSTGQTYTTDFDPVTGFWTCGA